MNTILITTYKNIGITYYPHTNTTNNNKWNLF